MASKTCEICGSPAREVPFVGTSLWCKKCYDILNGDIPSTHDLKELAIRVRKNARKIEWGG